MVDKKITELTPSTSPNGATVYGVEAGTDYGINVGSANGLAYLDGGGLVPLTLLGTGTPDNTKFLRGDGVWTVVSGGGGSGTVTSVGITPGTGVTSSGGPITTTGNITVGVNANLQSWSAITPGAKADASHTHTLSNLTQSGATSGQVPQWNGSAWVPATVSGGGGGGTVTSVNITPGTGVTASGGPITTTGSITVGLNANLQAWSGLGTSAKADTVHTHSGSDITSGTISPARLGTGTADSTKYLRGDGTWTTFSATGTVTSVTLSPGSTGLSVTNDTITSSGTMTLGGVLAVANGGTGGSSASGARQGLGIYVQATDPGAVADGSLWIY